MKTNRGITLVALVVCAMSGNGLAVGILTGPVPHNGHEYYLLDRSKWTVGEAEAVSMGGHLATINDQAENDWVWDTFSNAGARSLWIGFNDVEEDGNFVWTSGEPVTFTNWEPAQPTGGEHYTQMRYGVIPGHWNDLHDTDYWDSRGIHGVVEVIPEPPLYLDHTGHCYERIHYLEASMTWQETKAYAETLTYLGVQGHLATITSQVENDFLAAMGTGWIGGFQPSQSPEPDGNWQWVTGEPWGYTNWSPGEPNNSGDENTVSIQPGGGWNDREDWSPAGSTYTDFFVEYPVPEPATLSLLALGGLALLRRKRGYGGRALLGRKRNE